MTAITESTKRKLSLLQLAEELGNVSKACKIMGYHRDTFYEVRRAFQVGGVAALSYWAMLICVVTGLGGKYFYKILLHHRPNLLRDRPCRRKLCSRIRLNRPPLRRTRSRILQSSSRHKI